MRRLTQAIAAVLALVLLGAMVAPVSGATRTTRTSPRVTSGPRATSGRAIVLGYHAIADLDDEPVIGRYSVAPERFAEQLDTLMRRGWTFVDLDAVLAALAGERELPDRAVLLTFDDAYADLLNVVCPILEERGLSAVAFAVTDQVGGTNVWDNRNGAQTLDLLDADGLRQISERGIEIGSHTATHPHLPELPPDQLEAEVVASADQLESLGLPRPRAFSYPYGLWDPRVADAVRGAGYEIAFAVDRGVVQNGCNRYALPRTAVHVTDTGNRLHLKLASASWPKAVRSTLRLLTRARARVSRYSS